MFVVVNQASCVFREFLGSGRTQLEPGIHWKLPFFHQIRTIELRECFIPVDSLSGCTKDNVPIFINGSLFYKVFDPHEACYNVLDFSGSVKQVGMSSMRAVMGQFDYDTIIRDRNGLNSALTDVIGDTIKGWGASCTRFEIGAFWPQHEAVSQQLQLQLEAERKRRENILNTQARVHTSEGEKQSAILRSEGESVSQQNAAQGEYVTAQKKADAEKYAINAATEAMVNQLEEIAKVFGGDKAQAANFILEKQRLEHLSQLARSPNKVYFSDTNTMLPRARVLSDMFGEGGGSVA
jgi:regulator of protease activity HflC (stomatin/prohibitin superfamily)